MNAPDWIVTERIRDAERYSAMCEAGEQEARERAEREQQISRACAAIQRCDLDSDAVRQIISTLGCRMLRCGFSVGDVEMVESVGDCI